jgi:hypothetical protein
MRAPGSSRAARTAAGGLDRSTLLTAAGDPLHTTPVPALDGPERTPDSWPIRERLLDREAKTFTCRSGSEDGWFARHLTLGASTYIPSPVDLILNCIPGIGYLDEPVFVSPLVVVARRDQPAPIRAERGLKVSVGAPPSERPIGTTAGI